MRHLLLLTVLLSACTEYDLGREKDPPPKADDTGPRVVDSEPPEDSEAVQDSDPPRDSDPPVDETAPVADAGLDQEVDLYSTVWLNGYGSYDPGGNEPLTYRWTTLSKPAGSTVDISWMAGWATPIFSPDVAGDYRFQLGVTNTLGISDPTPDQVTVTARQPALEIKLEWDTQPTDIDMHIINSNAGIFDSPDDCCFCNMAPNWGGAGDTDDPGLYWDDIDGYGPEYVTIDAPANGDYRILMEFYGENGDSSCDGGCARTRCTVTVTLSGTVIGTYTGTLSNAGEYWEVGTLHMPAGTITRTDTYSTTTRTSCF